MTDPTGAAGATILVLNAGSSSLKLALFDGATRRLSGRVERIGGADARLVLAASDGAPEDARSVAAPTHADAARLVLGALAERGVLETLGAVGHRIVHGGPRHFEPTIVDDALLDDLRRLVALDPEHLPTEIALVEAVRAQRPGLVQVACFDTAFHRDLPRVARVLPLPRRFEEAGIRRYGFHGLSYTWLMEELERLAGRKVARGRVVLAHLGSGASLAAVRDGRCIDTTMAFTPTAGLVMATRSGDLDPGVLVHLARAEGLSIDAIDRLVNHEAGMLGVSGTSGDLRDLLARERDDARAADAVALFCWQARKWIGAMAAALGGLDTLVFAGGIGEHSPEARSRICDGLGFLGVALDPDRNRLHAPVISTDGAPATVRVIATDEERVIARAVARRLTG